MNAPRNPLPDWAERLVAALDQAEGIGHGHLPNVESRLLFATGLLIRSRLGAETVLADDAQNRAVVASFLRNILADLDQQEGDAR